MNIEVSYVGDLGRSFRATRRLRRKLLVSSRVIGALFLLFALLVAPGTGSVIIAVFVIVIFVECDLVLWLRLWRSRDVITQPKLTTLTDHGIAERTGTTAMEFGWDMVRQVIETRRFWIFVINPMQSIVLSKQHLTPAQKTEITAFLAARRRAIDEAPHPSVVRGPAHKR